MVKVKVAQWGLTQGHHGIVHGILQARILGRRWVAIPFSRGSSLPRDQSQVSHIAGRFFTVWPTKEAQESREWQHRLYKAMIFLVSLSVISENTIEGEGWPRSTKELAATGHLWQGTKSGEVKQNRVWFGQNAKLHSVILIQSPKLPNLKETMLKTVKRVIWGLWRKERAGWADVHVCADLGSIWWAEKVMSAKALCPPTLIWKEVRELYGFGKILKFPWR